MHRYVLGGEKNSNLLIRSLSAKMFETTGFENRVMVWLTFSNKKFEITPPIGSPPREN